MFRYATAGLVVMLVGCGDGGGTAQQACDASALQGYADRIAWLAQRTAVAHVPAARFDTSDEMIPPRAPKDAVAAALLLEAHGVAGYTERFSAGFTPEAIGGVIREWMVMERGRASGAKPASIVWELAATTDTPAAHVALTLMALRIAGVEQVSLILAQATNAPPGDHDPKVLASLNAAASAHEHRQRIEDAFGCAGAAEAIRQALGAEKVGPKAAAAAAKSLPDAMVACACKPSVSAYRAAVRHLGLGAHDPTRVAIGIPLTLDFAAEPIAAAAGATWGEVAAGLDSADPRRGWISTPDAPIPPAWKPVLLPPAPAP